MLTSITVLQTNENQACKESSDTLGKDELDVTASVASGRGSAAAGCAASRLAASGRCWPEGGADNGGGGNEGCSCGAFLNVDVVGRDKRAEVAVLNVCQEVVNTNRQGFGETFRGSKVCGLSIESHDVPVGARAGCGPRASIRSDGGGRRVGDGARGDCNTVDEPVAGDTRRDVSANNIDVDHGEGVGPAELNRRVARGDGDGGGGANLFFGDLLAGCEFSNASIVQVEHCRGLKGLEVVWYDAGLGEVGLDGLDSDTFLGGDKGQESERGDYWQGEH